MNLETFFEKFDCFADAPDAMANMRELVLQLAVQGKLVEQNPSEASAAELMEEVETARSANRNGGRGRKFEPLPPVKSDEVPFDIPNGWSWCRLGCLGLISSSSRVHEKDWTTQGIPFFRAREIVKLSKYGFIDNDLFITEEHYQRLSSDGLIPEANDIMITGVGTIGVPYVVGINDRFYFKDASVLIFKNCFELYPHYLRMVMLSPYWDQEIHKGSMGTTVHTLTIARAKQTPIPLPPLAEQKRIVAKVDELMAACDRLEQQQKERKTRHAELSRAALTRFTESPTPDNLRYLFHPSFHIPPADLRKSILTLAVQGKLVPQDPNDEPGEDMVARLEKTKMALAKKNGVRPPKNVPPLSADAYPHDIPDTWIWRKIGAIALGIDYGTSQRADNDPSKVPVYRMGNIVNGRLLDENLKYIDANIDDLPGLYLQPGDILFNRTNSYELVGKSGIYLGPKAQKTFASYLIRVRLPSDYIFPQFVSLAMNSPYFRQTQIEPEVVQQCGQANFNGTKLASTAVPIPPLAEQKRIVAKVDELMAWVEALETQLATARTTAANLLAAAVTELTTSP